MGATNLPPDYQFDRYRLVLALLLAAEYHQRWEVESAIDELKVHFIDRNLSVPKAP